MGLLTEQDKLVRRQMRQLGLLETPYERERHGMQSGQYGDWGSRYRMFLRELGERTAPITRPLTTLGASAVGHWGDRQSMGSMQGDPSLSQLYDPGYSESLPDAVALAPDSAFGEGLVDMMPGAINPQDLADLEAAGTGTDERVEPGEPGFELSPWQRAAMGLVGAAGATLGPLGYFMSQTRGPIRSIDAPVKSPGDTQLGTFGGRKGLRDPSQFAVHLPEIGVEKSKWADGTDWSRYYENRQSLHPDGTTSPAREEKWDGWVDQAVKMEESGAPAREIHEKTGLFRQPDGEWVYEVSDEAAVKSFRGGDLSNEDVWRGVGAQKTSTIGRLFPEWDLYEYYPDIKDIEVTTKGGSGGVYERAGWRKGGTEAGDLIAVGENQFDLSMNPSRNPKEAARTLIHEVQHAIQRREEWPGQGASIRGMHESGPWKNPAFERMSRDPLAREYGQLEEKTQSLREKMTRGEDLTPEEDQLFEDMIDRRMEIHKELSRKYGQKISSGGKRVLRPRMPTKNFEPFDAYRHEAGEVMSRLAENRARRHMSGPRMVESSDGSYELVDESFPLDDLDVNPEDVIVDKHGIPRKASKDLDIEDELGEPSEDFATTLSAPIDESGHARIMFSAERGDLSPEENARRMNALREELEDRGVPYRDTLGRYRAQGDEVGVDEDSVMVPAHFRDDAREIARAFGQESTLELDETGHGRLWFPGDDSEMPIGVVRRVRPGERVENSTVDPRTGIEYTVDEPPKPPPGRRYGRSTMKNPERKAYPGIYEDPREIAMKAEARVPDEDPILRELFGVTRADLARMAEVPGKEPGTWKGRSTRKSSSAAAERVMKPENARRLVEALEVAREQAPRLTEGMTGWYEMRPMYDLLVEQWGPEAGQKKFRDLINYMAMSSPGSNVVTEIKRGTAANMLAQQGRFDEFYRHGGMPDHARGYEGFPSDLNDVPSHPYHRTAQAEPMRKYIETGEIQSKEAKVPTYAQASMTEELGRQTDVPVGDAHWSRAVGLGDVRTNKRYGKSASSAEMNALAPWWRDEVAGKAGMESVPAQATTWGMFSGETGVATEVGVPKLELIAQQIRETARREGVDLKTARDRVIAGQARAGQIDPGLAALMGLGAVGGAGAYGVGNRMMRDEEEFEDLEE